MTSETHDAEALQVGYCKFTHVYKVKTYTSGNELRGPEVIAGVFESSMDARQYLADEGFTNGEFGWRKGYTDAVISKVIEYSQHSTLPVQKHDADTVERVAKEIAFSGRHQHDVSRNAREFWDHTGSYGQSAARVMARAALSAMPPQEVSVQEAARVLADAWSLESVEGCQFRCLVTRAGHDERISGLKFIAALRALSEKPHG